MPINLEIDLLRTFVIAADLGALSRAADKVGRSQSAVSLQMKKLEFILKQSLFRKQGRYSVLTDAGKVLEEYAKRILIINDEAISSVSGMAPDGIIHFAIASDLSGPWLVDVLSRFREIWPGTQLDIIVGARSSLRQRVGMGEVDMALIFEKPQRLSPRAEMVLYFPVRWFCAPDFRVDSDTLPLAVMDTPCLFRDIAVEALDGYARRWRIASRSAYLEAMWTTVRSGIGITARTGIGAPNLRVVDLTDGLPDLPDVKLSLFTKDVSSKKALDDLSVIVKEALEGLQGIIR